MTTIIAGKQDNLFQNKHTSQVDELNKTVDTTSLLL